MDGFQEVVRNLLQDKDFSQARRYLWPLKKQLAGDPELERWWRQKVAFCTYKDPELQAETALAQAWEVLIGANDPWKEKDSETLSLAGAIRKRQWDATSGSHYLVDSIYLYKRAYEQATSLAERVYAAVNVAYTLCCSSQELRALGGEERLAEAEAKRTDAASYWDAVVRESDAILASRPDQASWWLKASLAESFFGLGKYANAESILSAAIDEQRPEEWERESALNQLARLASLLPRQKLEPALAVLRRFIPEEAAHALVAGRLGLALSGGGFRAALFHVGVLARLAELDLLRHVQAISCVSGGSIVGALYYLQLRKELQEREDAEMTRDVYVAVVDGVRERLCRALKEDIRSEALMRTFGIGRTKMVGRLLDEALYSLKMPSPLEMSDLKIQPPGFDAFNPKRHNWRRAAKVPVLILNATVLNTGHNWQFTASWMGEPPTAIDPGVDATPRLRRLYYKDAHRPELRKIKLRTAVAASAAVPGIFNPVTLDGLYPGWALRLSDGGVHDNQGVFGLLEQDCSLMIVSDGCGQLSADRAAGWWFWPVVSRASDIMMDVIRRSSYRILTGRLRSGRLKRLALIHLKQGLPTRDVTWAGGEPAPTDALQLMSPSPVREDVQRALAAIRTDLDNFSLNERDALMAVGYLFARQRLSLDWASRFTDGLAITEEDWAFMPMVKRLSSETERDEALHYELHCGRRRLFRAFWRGTLGRHIDNLLHG